MITKEQIQYFHHNGVLHLKNAIDTKQLALLQVMADSLEKQALSRKNKLLFDDSNISLELFTPVLHRIKHIHRHMPSSLLGFSASEPIKSIKSALCSQDALLTAEMIIFKQALSQTEIPWHQDFIESCRFNSTITIGIYLDDSQIGDGNVQFLEGTHLEKQDICGLVHGNKALGEFTEFDVKAGDIVVHNPMVVHRSGLMRQNDKRRTLYYEFRTVENIQSQETWPTEFIVMRERFMKIADNYANNITQKRWDRDDARTQESTNEIFDITLPSIPANYCLCKRK